MREDEIFDDRPIEAQRLEKARKAAGFRFAKDAAKRFGWTYETYQQHEKGTRGFSKRAKEYAKRFRVDILWLLGEEGRGPSDEQVNTRFRLSPEEIAEIDAEIDVMRDALIKRRLERQKT